MPSLLSTWRILPILAIGLLVACGSAEPTAADRLAGIEESARQGKKDETLHLLDRLAADDAKLATPGLYLATADQMKAKDPKGSIEILDAGLKRFPDDAKLKGAIEQAKATGGEAEQDALIKLGYLGNGEEEKKAPPAAP